MAKKSITKLTATLYINKYQKRSFVDVSNGFVSDDSHIIWLYANPVLQIKYVPIYLFVSYNVMIHKGVYKFAVTNAIRDTSTLLMGVVHRMIAGGNIHRWIDR